jgi:phosphatidylethanolamine-binding protein (PEBP) family uncharacterized protein
LRKLLTQQVRNSVSIIKRLAIKNFFILICVCLAFSCSKDDNVINQEGHAFKLSSPVIGPDSLLPIDYTCDGESATLPLSWQGYPSNTAFFAIIMYHVASPIDIHWYWILYNIPSTIDSLSKNVSGIGILGSNSVNGLAEYAPPCSQGPGRKDYIITVYALSSQVLLDVSPEDVSRDVFLNAIEGSVLSNASMTVWYSRNVD